MKKYLAPAVPLLLLLAGILPSCNSDEAAEFYLYESSQDVLKPGFILRGEGDSLRLAFYCSTPWKATLETEVDTDGGTEWAWLDGTSSDRAGENHVWLFVGRNLGDDKRTVHVNITPAQGKTSHRISVTQAYAEGILLSDTLLYPPFTLEACDTFLTVRHNFNYTYKIVQISNEEKEEWLSCNRIEGPKTDTLHFHIEKGELHIGPIPGPENPPLIGLFQDAYLYFFNSARDTIATAHVKRHFF